MVRSTDVLIEEREKRTISEIFRDSGETYFRKIEKEVVADISKEENVIIDCGGGVVLDPENLAALKSRGMVFYLSATTDEIFHRVKNERQRPLLQTEDPLKQIEDLLAKRKSFYEQADHIIDTNERSPNDICQEILELMKERD